MDNYQDDGVDAVELRYLQDKSISERDNVDLTRLGKKEVLKRNFGFMSMLGFSCTVMITWEGELLLFDDNFSNGGYAGSVYGYIIVWLGTLCVFATMGELSSMAPTSGGQYHWVSMLAPSNVQKLLSYVIGWLTVVGWQAAAASEGYLVGSLIQGLIVMNSSTYDPKPYQVTLLLWAAIFFAVFINTVVSSALPKVEGLMLILHILGFFGILIPLVYLAPHTDATTVFTTFLNEGGWATTGLSFMVGLVGPVFNFLGADAAVHMSEEIKNASRVVPGAMIFSLIMNGVLGFGMLLAILFCLGDVDTVLSTPTGFPFMAIFQQGVESLGGATAMSAIITALVICATISVVASASRMTWSFARDRGLPGWKWLSKVHSKSSIPVISIALTTTVSCLLSLINLGSSVAFNDVVSLTVDGLYTSYFIGNSLLLWRRISGHIKPYNSTSTHELTNVANAESLTWGPWRIPEPFGTIINALGCLYMIIILFFSYWPTTMDPTPSTMNFSSLMVGATGIFSILYYIFWARRIYTGPVIEI
ncbi:hypothetical protein UA08_06903 [Talaromyces atroroseus]|uniref:Choline transport protein n=1 Tax=Talaromyces atroroseus TaxID=1441469 RepID=A0A225A9W3_TALAT|nr:hypothetical protein UA08_06903 [Talaromyces atroroseus]OKL57711.1 hypothetical protein UA08_06903 [Talaromyces atroroseus]